MMTQTQQQRLIGTLLLVFFIAVLAYLVLSKVSQTESERQTPEEEPIQFSSVIEPLQEKTEGEAEEEGETDSSSVKEAFVDINPEVTDNVVQLPTVAKPEVKEPAPVAPEPEKVAPTSVAEAPKAVPEPETKPAPAPEPEPKPAPVAKSPAPTVSKTEPTSTTSAEASSRWILQLGSFSVEANAISRKKQLEDLGYKPMIEQTRSGETVIYRVRLQPNEDRAVLEKMAESIRNQLKINTQIFPYQ